MIDVDFACTMACPLEARGAFQVEVPSGLVRRFIGHGSLGPFYRGALFEADANAAAWRWPRRNVRTGSIYV
jgi:hypothetical protein